MTLEEVRAKIDEIDRELLRLLDERAGCVNVVGEIKQRRGLEFYAPEREEQLLRRLVEINREQHGRLSERSIRAIYREIMSAALALEHPLKISYLGPMGSRTHQAALNKFGHGVSYLAEADLTAVFARVESKDANYGVVPAEHASQGVVQHAVDHFAGSALQICAQMLVSAGDGGSNRFFILGRSASPPTGDDHSMLLVDVPDQVGALAHLAQQFERPGVNMCHIENRPVPASEQATQAARFFIEVSGHALDAGLESAQADLVAQGFRVRTMGSFPACAWVDTVG